MAAFARDVQHRLTAEHQRDGGQGAQRVDAKAQVKFPEVLIRKDKFGDPFRI